MTKTDPNEEPLDGTRGKKKTPTVRQLLDAQMFTITSHECELAHLNTRTERHGEENAPAADLKLVVTGPHSLIEANSRIGRGTLVCAGSFVRGEYPDFVVLEGRPARVVGDSRQADEGWLQRHPELRAHYAKATA